MTISYKDSGVDLALYQQAMQRLPRLMHRTHSPRVIPNDGGFAGLFSLDFGAGSLFARNYENPVLVSGTDGVGTKLKVAQLCGRFNTLGIDLVAMCVNDVLCTGAEPLFFLDYVAMSRDDPAKLEQIVAGISDGCVQSDLALLGGETAIMPDVYGPEEFDLAGFCVGVVDKKQLIDGRRLAADDLLLGVASSGLHSNGYSLVRKIVFDKAQLQVDQQIEVLGESVGECLLKPTTIYAPMLRRVLQAYRVKQVVHMISHITGGGLLENCERQLPPSLDLVFERDSWPVPPVFGWLQQLGGVDPEEMERVFNMGIGLVLAVSPYFAAKVQQRIAESGLDSYVIGRVERGTGQCRWG